MDLAYSPDETQFRDEVRTWLAEHVPRDPRPRDAAAIREFDLAWQRTQWDGGWAGISWPARYGGRGLSLLQQMIWYEEYARVGRPSVDACFVALSHAGPTLITKGNEEQKSFHLPRILRGEVVWCQGFSEPQAGSDLAALATRARLDGDELVVDGQKIWTSYAHVADYQELLVRTGGGGTKHEGITWVICDMRSPGIDVRPIKTIDGGADFCEVFYDSVRIPLVNVVGEVGQGWSVAMSTLAFERGTAFTSQQVSLARVVEELIDFAGDHSDQRRRRPMLADEDLACRLATVRAEVASLRAMTYAGVCRSLADDTPSADGSILKLYYGELRKQVFRLALDILGPNGIELRSRLDPGNWVHEYLTSFSHTIAGGTSEIQRNIIGERVLGLPR